LESVELLAIVADLSASLRSALLVLLAGTERDPQRRQVIGSDELQEVHQADRLLWIALRRLRPTGALGRTASPRAGSAVCAASSSTM
jgi:hypothetical protein